MSLPKIMLAATLCLASTSFAQTAVTAPPAPAPVKEKKICRSEVPVGSIMAKRTCLTKQQWNALDGKRGVAAESAIEYVRARSNAAMSTDQ